MHWCKILKFLFVFVFMVTTYAKDMNMQILNVLHLVDSENFAQAVSEYEKLYKQTKDVEFLKEALRLAFDTNDKRLNELLKIGSKVLQNDGEFVRFEIMQLLKQNKISRAKEKTNALIKKEQDARNFTILGNINMFEGDNNKAYANFAKAYELQNNEENLIRLVSVTPNDNEIIKNLQNYREKNGCSYTLCTMLGEKYFAKNDFVNAASVYAELYEISQNPQYLDYIIISVAQTKDKNLLSQYETRLDLNSSIMMDAYANMGLYDMAYNQAKQSYEAGLGDVYQTMMAIYEYEQHEKNMSEKVLKNVMQNFENSVEKVGLGMSYNYYGYLLIIHDIDYKKGISLVQKALVLEPDSPYYLDSLAWGYYKLGDCNKASEIMQKVMSFDDIDDTDEIKQHDEAIKKCRAKSDTR